MPNLKARRSRRPAKKPKSEIDFEARCNEYIEAVLSGERVAGFYERASVLRYRADLDRQGTEGFPYVFSPEHAERACRFILKLKHTDGEYAGQPFLLFPWQTFVVRNIFGWLHRDTGFRRFRDAFITVARGNGKSPFGAAMLLYLLLFDNEPRNEIYVAAMKRDQARIAFDAAKRFVSGCALKDRVILKTAAIELQDGSKLEPLSSDGKSSDGLNMHALLRDELHAWDETKRDYLEKLTTGLKRRQPLCITITTAGSEESHIWREEYEFVKQVVDPDSPVESESHFVAIYEIDKDDDELDPAVWPKSNPMLEHGVVKPVTLQTAADKAKVDSSLRAQFKRYHGNRLTFSSRKSFDGDMWSKGRLPVPYDSVDEVYVGVDLGAGDDLSAVGVCAPLDWTNIEGISKRNYAVWCKAWVPEDGKQDLTKQPFRRLIEQGQLVPTDEHYTDYQHIHEYIEELADYYDLRVCALDKYNATALGNGLKAKGYEVDYWKQNCQQYNEPFVEFKQALSSGRIYHGNDEMLGWATLNVVETENQAGHIMPSKKKAIDKIDPFVAVLMAFGKAHLSDLESDWVYDNYIPTVI